MLKLKDFRELGTSIDPDLLKLILGGYGSCGFIDPSGYTQCDLSQAEALHFYDAFGPGSGAHWCCESFFSNGGPATHC